MRSSSKQLAVMEDMVVEGKKTLIDVFLMQWMQVT